MILHLFFSLWIIIWYIFYKLNLILFNPYIWMILITLYTIIKLFHYIYNEICTKTLIKTSILILIKIIIIITLNKSYKIEEFLFGIFLFIIYNIMTYIFYNSNFFLIYDKIHKKISNCEDILDNDPNEYKEY